MAKNKSNIPLFSPQQLVSMGINPKTGLPYKFGADAKELQGNIRKMLRVKDEQTAVMRYTWLNTMLTIGSTFVERFLYYKYSMAFFYFNEKFWLMPYTLNGDLDFYSMENYISPIPLNDDASEDQKHLLASIKLKVVKRPIENPTMDDILHSAVIIRDYTPQLDIQKAIPRQTLQDSIIDLEATMMPYMRTAMMMSTGIQGILVQDEAEYTDILEGAASVDKAAQEGRPWIPLTSKLQKDPLGGNSPANAQDYLLAMQGIDNFRESMYGLNTGGLFTKKEHTNDSENALNQQLDFPLTDGLQLRQQACDIINSIWGIGIWCEISETALNADTNGDFMADDSEGAKQIATQEGGNENEPNSQD